MDFESFRKFVFPMSPEEQKTEDRDMIKVGERKKGEKTFTHVLWYLSGGLLLCLFYAIIYFAYQTIGLGGIEHLYAELSTLGISYLMLAAPVFGVWMLVAIPSILGEVVNFSGMYSYLLSHNYGKRSFHVWVLLGAFFVGMMAQMS